MYLRAAKVEAEDAGIETEGMANSVSELRASILSLTNNRVDIMENDTDFKSTVQIMREISGVYDSLSDIDQAALLELLSGKRQANTTAALIKNWAQVENVIESSKNSLGSAERENAHYLDSIEGKTQQFSAKFEELSTSILDSEFVKGVVDTGSGIIGVIQWLIDHLGAIPGLIAPILVGIKQLNGGGILGTRVNEEGRTVLDPFWSRWSRNRQNTIDLDEMRISDDQDILRRYIREGVDIQDNRRLEQYFRNSSSAAVDFARNMRVANMTTEEGEQAVARYAEQQRQLRTFTARATSVLKGFGASIASMGITAAIAFIVSTLANGLNEMHMSASEAAQVSADVTTAYTNSMSEISQGLDSVTSLEDRFTELSAGVSATGENLSLTTDEYEEYRNIVEQLVDLNPTLVQGYNEQGDAIINQNTAIEKSIALLRKQQIAAARESVYGGSDTNDGGKTNYEATFIDFEAQLDKQKGKMRQAASDATDLVNEIWANAVKSGQRDAASETILDALGLSTDDYSNTVAILRKNQDLVAEKLPKLTALLAEKGFADRDAIATSQELADAYRMEKEAMDSTADGLRTRMQAIFESNESYYDLKDNSKAFLENYIQSMNWDDIEALGAENLMTTTQNLLDTVVNDGNVRKSIDQMYELLANKDSMPADEFMERGVEISQALQDGIMDNDVDVAEIFNLDGMQQEFIELRDKIRENFSDILDGLNIDSDLINSAFDGFDFGDLSLEQMRTFNRLLSETGEYAPNVVSALAELQTMNLLPEGLDKLASVFEDQVTAAEAAQDALTDYQTTAENLITAADTHEGFVEIFDDFADSVKRGRINTEEARNQMELLIGRVVDLKTARSWIKENEGLFLTGEDEELGSQELPAIYDTLHEKYKALNEEQRKYFDSMMSIDWKTGSFLIADGDMENVAELLDMSTAAFSQAVGVMESYSDIEITTPDTLNDQVNTMVQISDYLAESVDKDAQATTNAWKSLWGHVDWKVNFEDIASSMGLDATEMTVEEVTKLGQAFQTVSEGLNSLPQYTQAVQGYLEAWKAVNSIEDKDSEAYTKALAQLEEYDAKLREIPTEVLTRYGIEIPTDEEIDGQIQDLKERLSGGNIDVSNIVNAKVDGEYVNSDIENQIVQGDGIQFALHYIPVVDGEEVPEAEVKAYLNEITKDAKDKSEVLQRDQEGKGILVHVSAGVALDKDVEDSWDNVTEQMVSEIQKWQSALDQNGFVFDLSTLEAEIKADGDGALSGVKALIDQINEKAKETVVTLQQMADGSWQLDIADLEGLSGQLDGVQEHAKGIFSYVADLMSEAGTPVDLTVNGEPANDEVNTLMSNIESVFEELAQEHGININAQEIRDADTALANLKRNLQNLSNIAPTVRVHMAFDSLPSLITNSTPQNVTPSTSINGSGYSGITGSMPLLNSMASGGQSKGGRTLVGELGRELWISRDGKNKKIVGKDGMEVINMKPGDAIVPNNLTEQLIRGGMRSAASGAGTGALENWESTAKPKKTSSSKKKSSSSSKKSSDDAKDEYADWVQEQLDIMQHMIDVWNEKGGFEKFGDEIIAKYAEMQKFVHDAAEHYRKLGYAETSKEIRELQDKWFDYRNSIRDVYKDIYDAQKSSAEGSISILEQQMEMLEQKIGVSTAAFRENIETPMEFTVSDDASDMLYEQIRENAEQQIELQEQIMKAAHKEADRYRDMGYLDTSDEIQELKQTYLSAQQAITDVKQTVADKLVTQFDDFIELADAFDRWDNLNLTKLDVLRRKLSQINSLLSDGLITLQQYKEYITDVSTEIYNEQKDAIESIIDLTMDMLQQQQQDEIDAIQEQVDLYQQKVDLIKETIRLNGDEDDYQRDLEKKLREIAKLQAKIDQLSLDDSREAAAQKAQLAEQLAQLQEELAELQGDRGVEIQEEALDKENEKYQDASNEKIDILEDQYSSTQKLHDAAIKYIEENWNTLKDQLIQYNYQYGDSLEDEIIDKWEIARQAVERYGMSVNAALQGIENENIGAASDKSAIIDIISQMQANSQKWLDDPENRSKYEAANQKLGSQLSQYGVNARYDSHSGKWFVGDSDIELYDLTQFPSIIDQIVGSRYPIQDTGDGDNYLDDDYADMDEDNAKFEAKKEDILDVIEEMYRNQQRWLQTTDSAERQRLADANDELGTELSRLGLNYYHDHRAGTWNLGGKNGPQLYSAVNNPDILDSYIRYHSGGIAGSLKPNEVAAILERGEAIYTEKQNDQIARILELQQKLAQVLSQQPVQLPEILGNIRASDLDGAASIAQNTEVHFAPEIHITVSGDAHPDDRVIRDIRDNVLDALRSAFLESGLGSSTRMQFRPA